jgi:hypothetical protein
MRIAGALLVAAAIVPAAVAAPGARHAGPPSITFHRTPHFVVAGTGFRSDEKVTVLVSSLERRAKAVAAANGAFRIDLGTLHVAKCAPLRIAVIGNLGSRVTMGVPARICALREPIVAVPRIDRSTH